MAENFFQKNNIGYKLKIAIASDHAGFKYKQIVMLYLKNKKIEVIDFGTNSEVAVDYPTYIKPAVMAVSQGKVDRAVIFGGSGNGEAMVANRIKGIRCAVSWNVLSAEYARKHNDANVLSIGERLTSSDDLPNIIDAWLSTEFEGGRHIRRIEMIDFET